MDIKEKIKGLPSGPGVYLFKDPGGEVQYIGKANNLKKRVASYFRSGARRSPRLDIMVSKVRDVDYIRTSTSAEALLYENSLIKQYKPRYNVALRDDKTYPLLKLTANERFPRLLITRRKKLDGSVYYGPFTSARLLREALTILYRMFPLRRCKTVKGSVCLNYHIKQCLGPCEGKICEKRYSQIVAQLKLFLEGRKEELVKLLSKRMILASKDQDFEEAARLRDTIDALRAIKDRKAAFAPYRELEELKNILSIPGRLEVIEAFDVSNIMGEEACGSMVVFRKGSPRKSEYKRFKIKSVSGIDDYKMIKEVVSRRCGRLLREKRPLPDLILIDGGRGHLSAAVDTLRSLGISDIPVIGIAKALEKIYLKGRTEPIILPKDSRALHLIQRIRDEAHRFAISYHKKLMRKRIWHSELDTIEGLGEKRRKGLLERFGSVENMRAADKEELMKARGMSGKVAERIIRHFKKR
ncbi:helix-hairpin-helix domain-containing protein [Candidatus Omnitrophota bacterium]